MISGCHIVYVEYAGMAELADALDSGSSEVPLVQVQVLLPAPELFHDMEHTSKTRLISGFSVFLGKTQEFL